MLAVQFRCLSYQLFRLDSNTIKVKNIDNGERSFIIDFKCYNLSLVGYISKKVPLALVLAHVTQM